VKLLFACDRAKVSVAVNVRILDSKWCKYGLFVPGTWEFQRCEGSACLTALADADFCSALHIYTFAACTFIGHQSAYQYLQRKGLAFGSQLVTKNLITRDSQGGGENNKSSNHRSCTRDLVQKNHAKDK